MRLRNFSGACTKYASKTKSAEMIRYLVVSRGYSQSKEDRTIVYHLPQHKTIRIMFGIALVNFYAWSGLLFNHYFFEGQSIGGIDLSAGDPTFGYVGTAASFGLAYFTKYFANHVVYSAYLTKDQKRIGFQVHNMFGSPGKIMEVDVGNAKFNTLLDGKEQQNKLLSSSYYPIKVKGLDSLLLVEKEGFSDKSSTVVKTLSSKDFAPVESKESRKEWYSKVRRKK